MAVAITQTANPTATGTGTGTTITYSNLSIGTAAADRVVVLVVGTELTAGAISSATIDYGDGAIAMSSSTNGATGAVGARAFWKHAPTGTTATFAVTFAASQTEFTKKVAVYRAVGAAEVASSSGGLGDTDADPISSGAITIPTGGGCVGVCVMAATGVRTWAGITENIDESVSTAFQFTTGISTTAGSPTITVSGANAEDGALAWVVLKPGHDIIIGAGSYAVTGQDVTLSHGYAVAVDAGSYALSGQDVTLSHGFFLGIDAGSYAITGQDVSLSMAQNRAIVFWAEISFVIGSDELIIGANAGSYAVTGQDVTLTHAWVVAVDSASYSINGQDVALSRGLAAAVDAGSYALSGQDVTLTKTWLLNVDADSYAVTGQDVALQKGLAVGVDAGSYALAGQDVAVLHDWRVNVDAGSYAVTGQDVALQKGLTLGVDAGSYSITGQDVALSHQWLMDAGSGSYLVSGQNVALDHRFYLRPDADISDGTWTDQDDGSDLYAAINEESFDDADYIKSASNPTNDTCVVSLGDPGRTPTEPAKIRYRYWRQGTTGDIELRVRLLEGASQIAVWTHSDIDETHITAEQELSAPEFAAITDFANLRLEFQGQLVVTDRVIVSWADLSFGTGPFAYSVVVEVGSYSVGGQDISLEYSGGSRAVVSWADISFGVDASILSVVVDAGSYTVSGQDVVLVLDELESTQPGGGQVFAAYRPTFIGQAYGVLPDLIGRARGVVGVVGAAAAILPTVTGSARGDVGDAGDAVAKFAINGRSGGDVVVTANGRAVVQIRAKASAARGVQGNANAQLSIKASANGRNDADDMTAIVAILMAA